MDISKYIDRGYTGLVNLGNTCFLNSCIQALSHTYELNEILNSNKFKKYIKKIDDSEILNEYNDLRTILWNQNGVVSPNKFVLNVHKIAKIKDREVFTGYDQNDMPEFLMFLIDCMHNSISRPIEVTISGNIENDIDNIAVKCYELVKNIYTKEYSEFMDLFYGIYISQIVSKNGKTIHSIKPEQFLTLDLQISNKKDCNLYDCFDEFTNNELLDGDNKWFNEKTEKKEVVKKNIIFWSFPKILIIVLKRFSEDGSNKNLTKVDFPITNLDLSKYIKGYNASKYIYDLYGICNHIGNLNGGHYTSFIKTANKEWVHFNDANISKITTTDLITPMSYCLFYRKKNK